MTAKDSTRTFKYTDMKTANFVTFIEQILSGKLHFLKTDTNSLAETLMSFASCYENAFYRKNTWITRKDSMKHRFLEKTNSIAT